MANFAATPQLYDVVPLYNGYMKFAREEYLAGNKMYFASPFIDGKTALSLVMNTGGRDLIVEHHDDIDTDYEEYVDELLDEDDVPKKQLKPFLFTRSKQYKKIRCKVLQKILKKHFKLYLQPQYDSKSESGSELQSDSDSLSDLPQQTYFHCKWAASMPSTRSAETKGQVLLTSANLTKTHMQREQLTDDNYHQHDTAYVVDMGEDAFNREFPDKLKAFCKLEALVQS